MLDMCKYNMASQHDSMTQVIYSIGSEERDITNRVSRPNIQSIQVKAQAEAIMSEYRHLQMKRAEKPDYLSDPAGAQDRS